MIGTWATGACTFLPSTGSRPEILSITELPHAHTSAAQAAEKKKGSRWTGKHQA
jgi:hypothetical protein